MTTLITEPGLYDIPAATYHADKLCAEPSLSKSIAKLLIGLTKTPRHAWLAHPRLNPDFEEVNKTIFDLGKAAEAFFIGGDAEVVVIDAADYRTKDAKAARDDAWAAGKTPLLPLQHLQVLDMAEAARAQLAQHEVGDPFIDGQPQRTMVWKEGGVWCRARLDWLPDDTGAGVFYDYKTTTDAHPDVWQRRCFETGADLQDAFYCRGIRAVFGIDDPVFRFVVQEREPPYALSVIELTPTARAQADGKIAIAIEAWRGCLERDSWPGFSNQVAYIDAPGWEEVRFEAVKARDQQLRDLGHDPLKSMIDWQAPLAAGAAE